MSKATLKLIVLAFTLIINQFSISQINEAIKFKITDPNGNYDEAIVRIIDNSSQAFDGSWDAWKLFTTNDMIPSLYSETNNTEPLAINAIPYMMKDTSLNLIVRARITSGTYTITTEQLGTFPNNIKIALRDLETNNIYELNQNQSINFDIIADLNNDIPRFELFYSTKIEHSVFENNLTILNKGASNWNYEIYDSGQNLIQSGSSIPEEAVVSNLPVDTYTLIVVDQYNLADTLSFEILYEEPNTASIIENTKSKIFLIYDNARIYLRFNNELINEDIQISTYSLSGALIATYPLAKQQEQIELNLPKTQSYYLIVVNYRDKIKTFKVMSN